jgi:hypothetical protein
MSASSSSPRTLPFHFFAAPGMKLERRTIEGEWAGRVTGLGSQRVGAARYEERVRIG